LNIRRPPVGRLITLQLGILLLISSLFLLESALGARSALFGGLAYWIPNSLFALRYFRHSGARRMGAVFAAMMAGEMFKLSATVVLLAGTLMLIQPIDGPALFTGFGTMILSHMLTPLVFSRVANR
jgi:ATP synthase protein I